VHPLEDLRRPVKERITEGCQLHITIRGAIDADHDDGFDLVMGDEVGQCLVDLPLALCSRRGTAVESHVPSNI
jgi:hypothetical protein